MAGVVKTFYKCTHCNSCSKKILCYHRFHLYLEVLPSVNNIGKSWLAIFISLRDWAQANVAMNFLVHPLPIVLEQCSGCSRTVNEASSWKYHGGFWASIVYS